jgi:pimeloyl-ACP methyl ester carboxylesterase
MALHICLRKPEKEEINMPYANNDGIRIHYHVEGEGPPLVLQHGVTSSLRDWYDSGYVEPLKKDYRLILIDARGHGRSDKPHNPAAYDLKLRVADVTAVLEDLNIDKAHYLGYSMGGRIGFGIAMHTPERFYSLIIGGQSPYDSSAQAQGRIELLKQGMETYVSHTEAQSGPIAPDRRARLLANDPEALIASEMAPRGLTGMEQVLPAMMMPCLLYVGEADSYYPGARACVEHIPNATFVSFPGLDHPQTFLQAGHLVVPHVTEFLKEVVHQVGVAGR